MACCRDISVVAAAAEVCRHDDGNIRAANDGSVSRISVNPRLQTGYQQRGNRVPARTTSYAWRLPATTAQEIQETASAVT